jgi:hypothetical protein
MLLSAATALAVLSAVPALSLAADDPSHNFQQQQEQRDVAVVHQSAQEAAGPPAYRLYSSNVAQLND